MRTTTKAMIALIVASGTLLGTAIAAAGSDATPSPVPPVAEDPGIGSGSSSGSGGGGGVNGSMPVMCGPAIRTIEPTMAPVPTPPDTPVSSSPCPGVPIDHPPTATNVDPTPGMANVHPIAWTSTTLGADDRTVTVNFVTGVAPCAVLDHVGVDYAADSVTITLYQGNDPSMGAVACPDIAMYASTKVTLDQPLAGRTIVDGAK
jgi:hypothetical protein